MNFTDKNLERLINLESLQLHRCNDITDKSIEKLINLKKLGISECKAIDGTCVEKLLQLKSLKIRQCGINADKNIQNIKTSNIYEKLHIMETVPCSGFMIP